MAKMTKWDTIQQDVADMYIGKQELEDWEQAYKADFYAFFDEDEIKESNDGLTLDWEE